jgi:hypothetical protein
LAGGIEAAVVMRAVGYCCDDGGEILTPTEVLTPQNTAAMNFPKLFSKTLYLRGVEVEAW